MSGVTLLSEVRDSLLYGKYSTSTPAQNRPRKPARSPPANTTASAPDMRTRSDMTSHQASSASVSPTVTSLMASSTTSTPRAFRVATPMS